MHGGTSSLTLIGLGAVGRRLGAAWQRAGIAVLGHSRTSASRTQALAEGLTVEDDLAKSVAYAETILLCVGDEQLSVVARQLEQALQQRLHAANPGAMDARAIVCVHTSGSRDASVLAPLGDLGCATGTLYPLVAFAPGGSGPRLEGAWCVIGGELRARSRAAQLVAAIGARVLELNESQSAQANCHAAAALLSNGAVALTSIAMELAERACRDPSQARLALLGLLRVTLANLEQHPPERALTGPLSRGDVETLRRHLEVLALEPDTLALYRALSKQLLNLAVRDGRLDAAQAQAVARVLAP